MNKNFNSIEDYKNGLINQLTNIQNEMDSMDEGKLDEETFNIWVKVLKEMCDENYINYINNVIEDFVITSNQLMESLEKAKDISIDEALCSLSEKGLVDVSINEKGELLYSLSEEGKKTSKQINK
jgi:hypothetical protein